MNEQNNNFPLAQLINDNESKNVEISNINNENDPESDSENKLMDLSNQLEHNNNKNNENNNELQPLNTSNQEYEEQNQQQININKEELYTEPSVKKENEKLSLINNNPNQQNVFTNPIYDMDFNMNNNNVNNNCKSFYENFDIQQMKYALMKNYSQLKINKDEEFMERMKFDIYKRQIKEDKINKLIEQNKNKLDEDERIKAFNRLIEDANRRIEAQDNLNTMRNKLDNNLIAPCNKKYTSNEWKSVYNERFLQFLYESNKKREEKIKEKRQQEQMEEEEEVALCKNKKANRKVCEESGKRMYEEALKRKVKLEEKMKKIKSNNINNNKDDIKDNKKIDKKNILKTNIQKMPNNSNVNRNTNSNIAMNDKKKDKQKPILNIHQQKEYLEKFLREEDDFKDQRNMPVPMTNPMKGNFLYSSNLSNIERKNLENAAINRLQSKSNNTNVDYIKKSSIDAYRGHNRFYKESDANKIVDKFFTQKLKQIH